MPVNPVEGGGPWSFRNKNEISPGGIVKWDFENMEYNGRKKFFKPWLPMDDVQVTNKDPQNNVSTLYNGIFEGFVLANSVEGFDRQGIVSVQLENEGNSAIPAGNLIIEVTKEPYSGDDAALERKKRGKFSRIVRSKLGFEL